MNRESEGFGRDRRRAENPLRRHGDHRDDFQFADEDGSDFLLGALCVSVVEIRAKQSQFLQTRIGRKCLANNRLRENHAPSGSWKTKPISMPQGRMDWAVRWNAFSASKVLSCRPMARADTLLDVVGIRWRSMRFLLGRRPRSPIPQSGLRVIAPSTSASKRARMSARLLPNASTTASAVLVGMGDSAL